MWRFWFSFAVLLTTAAGCGTGDRSDPATIEPPKALSVYVVNYPLAYFAERIGGELVEVHFPAPAGPDPAYWTPDAETIAAYQAADLILLNGAGYARWVDRASLPASKLVDTSASFASLLIPTEGAVTHSHGTEGAHEHTGWDHTTWLDPTLAVDQAEAVSRALISRRPVYEAIFNERFTALAAELRALDERQAAAAQRLGNTPILFSHPVFQYLIRRYGLNGRSLHWEPDEDPDLLELEHLLEEQATRWMIWEGEPLPETVAKLDEFGVRSVVYDPCGNVPREGDFMTVMATNAAALETVAAR